MSGPDQLTSFLFGLNFASMFCLILAAQIDLGLPPIYKRMLGSFPFYDLSRPSKKVVETVVIAFGIAIPFYAVAELTEIEILKIGFSLPFVWAVLKIRSRLREETSGPIWFSTNYWVLKWPMLPFDVWILWLPLLFFLASIS